MVIDEENVISFAPNKDKKRSQSPAKISQSPATNFRPLDFAFRCTHKFTELQRTGSPNSLFFSHIVYTHNTSEVADLSNTQDACFIGLEK